MNVKFCYKYRDGANYKKYNEIVFANPLNRTLEEIECIILQKLIEGEWFVDKDWEIPDLHFKEYVWDTGIDHDWHELDCIQETNKGN
jgi:hypothetical protein